eukprot:SAG11_NODE_610_length_8221_cov_4.801650_3_plen_89_part_00
MLQITEEAKQAAVAEDAEGTRRCIALGGPVWLERRRSWFQKNGEKVVLITGDEGQRQFVWLRDAWDDATARRISEKACIASQLLPVRG